MIELINCSINYGDLVVLDSISVKIEHGEKVAIIGLSGSGKSTLLREIYRQHALPGAAFVHQNLALVPQLMVFHNVYMGRLDQYSFLENVRNLILPRADRLSEVGEVLHSLGIADRINSRASLLSGGEQQRVAIARALYRGGELFLGDEPVSAVDPHNSERVMQLLIGLQQTVVLSLHNIETAMHYCARVVGLRNGRILFDLASTRVGREELDELYAPC